MRTRHRDDPRFAIVAYGKLGGKELGYGSDLDIVFVYDDEDERAQEVYAAYVRKLINWLTVKTSEGDLFEIDTALRPNGNSGPAVVSLNALEEYFQVQGREWERFAWLKSRVVAPQRSLGSAVALRDTVQPFVFRRYLDYNVFEALRGLHRQIRDQAQRSSAGRPERANDVKLSRGGIREIEFIVQLLQVVRGGQFPELSTRATLQALDRLV